MTKELGVIGGLGPMATAYYLELVVKMTEAGSDKEHLPMIIFNRPNVPDRTEYILGKSKDNPVKPIIETGKLLASLGVAKIAIPCITAHYFYEEIQRGVGVPVINMIRETADYLRTKNIQSVGIMATEGTIAAGFFTQEIEKQGIKVITPTYTSQKKIMSIIYDDIKANRPYNIDSFKAVEQELKDSGAEVIILGCTELSLIKRDGKAGSGFLDALEILALRSIEASGGLVKEEYKNLLI